MVGNSGDLRNYPTINYPVTEAVSLSCAHQNDFKTIRVSLVNYSRMVVVDLKNSKGDFVTYFKQAINLTPPQGAIRAGVTFSTGLIGSSNFWIKGVNLSALFRNPN